MKQADIDKILQIQSQKIAQLELQNTVLLVEIESLKDSIKELSTKEKEVENNGLQEKNLEK